MHLELNREDARFLHEQLARQLAHVEEEAAHTDKHSLQHELAVDADRLRELVARIASGLRRDEGVEDAIV